MVEEPRSSSRIGCLSRSKCACQEKLVGGGACVENYGFPLQMKRASGRDLAAAVRQIKKHPSLKTDAFNFEIIVGKAFRHLYIADRAKRGIGTSD